MRVPAMSAANRQMHRMSVMRSMESASLKSSKSKSLLAPSRMENSLYKKTSFLPFKPELTKNEPTRSRFVCRYNCMKKFTIDKLPYASANSQVQRDQRLAVVISAAALCSAPSGNYVTNITRICRACQAISSLYF